MNIVVNPTPVKIDKIVVVRKGNAYRVELIKDGAIVNHYTAEAEGMVTGIVRRQMERLS